MIDKPLTPDWSSRTGLAPGRRVYAVGDVHGHLDRLERIHDAIRADLVRRPVPDPLLVHLGDLIDRGPDSAGCIALLAPGPPIAGVPTVNLLGNHEWMLLAALDHGRRSDDAEHWVDSGGAAALRSWGVRASASPREWMAGIPARHLVFLRSLRTSHVEDGYAFVHAGVRPGVPLARQREEDLLWIRGGFLPWDGVMLPEAPDRVIVHGHTPGPAAVLKPNRVGLDTGAGKGGLLTCGVFEGTGLHLIRM